jgi:GntR family transcriptional regulator
MKDIKTYISIDKQSPIPIYHQLSEGIKDLIETEILTPNDRIPSENELSSIYGIVPMTVRQAMAELVKKGLIYRVRGKGTFVSPHALDHPLDNLISFSEDMRSRNLTPSSKILYFENELPSLRIAEILNIHENKKILHVKRLRLANDKPVGFHDSYISGAQFNIEELKAFDSIYALFENKEVFIVEGKDVLEAVEADDELSMHLGVRVGSPLLLVTRVSYDSSARPVEFVKAFYRSDLYRYSIQLRRKRNRS